MNLYILKRHQTAPDMIISANLMNHSPSSIGRLDKELQFDRVSSSEETEKNEILCKFCKLITVVLPHKLASTIPAMITEARCVGFFPFFILYWFISSSICCSLCIASRQFLLLFFLTVLHSSGSLASFLAASTIFRWRANRLSRFLRKGSCKTQQKATMTISY